MDRKQISTSKLKFVDKEGRQVILHGINMVCKEREQNYIGNYTNDDFQMLKQWGFNVIRLGIFWDGIEPVPGCYDEEYLKKIDEIIAMASQHELAVYLDMHQDLFSCKYSDGAPEWATLTEGTEHVTTELWSESYLLSGAVQRAFDEFWNDSKASDGVGIQEHFIRMWKHIAKRYAFNSAVIGYDFFNEPFPGSAANLVMMSLMEVLKEQMGGEMDEEALMALWLDQENKQQLLNRFNDKEKYRAIVNAIEPSLQQFDQSVLSAFYQKIGSAVREVDQQTLLFLEANYFCNTGVASHTMPIVDATGAQDEFQVFSPHGYDLMVDTQLYEQSSTHRLEVIFEAHKKVQDRLQMPVLVGEWGCFPNAGDAELLQAQFLMELFSQNLFSDTYFDFSHIKNNQVLDALVRPYPMNVAGELLSYSYDVKNKVFQCKVREQLHKSYHRFFVPDVDAIESIEFIPSSVLTDTEYRTEYCNEQKNEVKNKEENKAGYLIIATKEHETLEDSVRQISFRLKC